MGSRLINLALYQTGWFCCVLGAANDRPWLGAAIGSALILVHLALLRQPLGEVKLLLAAGLLGGLVDSLQSSAGLLVFHSGHLLDGLAPPWILLMWMQFATLFRFGLSFLSGRFVLGAVLGAIGGPLSFWAGARLGAVEFAPQASHSLIVLGLVWAGAMPLLLWLSARWTDTDSPASYRGFGAVPGS